MDKNAFGKKCLSFLQRNAVVLIFAVVALFAMIASKQPATYFAGEITTRIARNAFLVLSLIIPVLAGMGLNFGIVVGAMAAQIAVFFGVHWNWTGLSGFFLTALLATPIAMLFGYLVGRLFNRIKGMEMIGGLVLGYCADGLYQLLFLVIFGTVIKIDDSRVMMTDGATGAINTIDLTPNIGSSLDTTPLLSVIEVAFYAFLVFQVAAILYRLMKKRPISWARHGVQVAIAVVVYALTYIPYVEDLLRQERLLLLVLTEFLCLFVLLAQAVRCILALLRKQPVPWKSALGYVIADAIVYGLTYIPAVYDVLVSTRVPMFTYLVIAALFVFNNVFSKTRLGHNIRAVGQSREIAFVSGINVDRTRIIAMIFSTIFAAWGQLINLQNLGTLSTYYAHTSIGTFAIAALLVGGASVHKANSKQAILGVILFHSLYVAAPAAGRELFGNAVVGEYFRTFVSYGIIAVALAMHAGNRLRELRASQNENL